MVFRYPVVRTGSGRGSAVETVLAVVALTMAAGAVAAGVVGILTLIS